MYVIRHKQNKNYYKSNISKNIKHFVTDVKEARKIKTHEKAKQILKEFRHPKNYEIVRINNERYNNL